MTFQTGPELSADESDWIAVRYLLEELSAEDIIEFEERLAVSQPCRESLARATTLIEVIGAVAVSETALPPQAVARHGRSRRVRYAIAAVLSSAAAAMLLIAGLQSRGFDQETAGGRERMDSARSSRIVALWVDSAESLNGLPEADASDDFGGSESRGTLMPPDWLLAAVEYDSHPVSPISDTLQPDGETVERN